MDRKYPDIMSEQCEIFIRNYWDDEDIVQGLKEPIKYIREVINPWLRERQKEGKDFPTIVISKRNEKLFLILSTE